MKLLIATTELQGQASDDFMRAIPGELVVDVGPCEDATASDDWSCACARSFVGLTSGRMTTTAKVVDHLDIDAREYIETVRDAFGTWCCPDCATEIALISRRIAGQWDAGQILERYRSVVRARLPHLAG